MTNNINKQIPVKLLSILLDFINATLKDFDYLIEMKDYEYDEKEDCHIIHINDELVYWNEEFSKLAGELTCNAKEIGENVYVFFGED